MQVQLWLTPHPSALGHLLMACQRVSNHYLTSSVCDHPCALSADSASLMRINRSACSSFSWQSCLCSSTSDPELTASRFWAICLWARYAVGCSSDVFEACIFLQCSFCPCVTSVSARSFQEMSCPPFQQCAVPRPLGRACNTLSITQRSLPRYQAIIHYIHTIRRRCSRGLRKTSTRLSRHLRLTCCLPQRRPCGAAPCHRPQPVRVTTEASAPVF